MGQSYVGEIQICAGNFAPLNWHFCDGSLLAISEYDTLFSLIGTTYGGDGQTTFAVPDLRGRIPIHQGGGFVIGQSGGAEAVTLTTQQLPVHSHPMTAAAIGGDQPSPAGNVLANSLSITPYINDAPGAAMAAAIAAAGGSQPHNNLQPYICINYIISLFGIYPSPS